ncbi:MAG: TRAP transporter substrate-binding protein [Casimicrobiaceae bacterium]|nr:TRAP transporter substrate-binding protein [Casimicrobiaceae bacterium]MCX8098601.1 TRAP transporter substrate-binding protein [Casimicrobiaceae bacterium]MDW8311999.1 TRAP transporter substrate-binding protein [Burkholderiales bacterium]
MSATRPTAASHDKAADPPARPARRRALRRAALAAAGIAGAPAVYAARPILMRLQSAWPARDVFHEYARDFAAKVELLSGGRLRFEVLPAGAVVKAFDLLDAVSRGVLDAAHATLAYWTAKNSALGLWSSGPAFGMDANTVLAWHEHGGGKALLAEIYKGLDLDVVSFLYGPMPTQPLGWFKKPVRSLEDLKNLRFRTVGLAVELFTELGMRVTSLPPAEVVTALDRGQLDAAEYNNATSDRALGFPEVTRYCMLKSFHQSSEQFEVLVNRTRFERLPRELQIVLREATRACSAEMSWKALDRYSKDYEAMREAGVQFLPTPTDILEAQLKAWNRIVARRSAHNPMFARVATSMESFARRVCRWQFDTSIDYAMAFQATAGRPRS